MVKKGFTFVELIVAIVVIGIALMSVPLLLSQSSRSDEFSINQEAILAATTKMGDILTYPWNDTNSSGILHVFDVTHGDNNLSRYPDNNSTRRIGHFKEKYRRKFYDQITEANSTLGHDKGDEFDDIDDFNGQSTSVSAANGANGDYIQDLNLSVSIFYIRNDDVNYLQSPTLNLGELNISSHTPTTNIKMVEVNVSDTHTGDLITTLKAFSCNIGSYQLLYRTFP